MGKHDNQIDKTIMEAIRSKFAEKELSVIGVAELPGNIEEVSSAVEFELAHEKDQIKSSILKNLLAVAYSSMARIEEAEQLIREVIGVEALPGNIRAGAFCTQAWIFLQEGKYQDALEVGKNSLSLVDPENIKIFTQVLNTIAMIHAEGGRFDLSVQYNKLIIDALEKSENQMPLISVHVNIAMSYQNLGRNEDALQHFRKAEEKARETNSPFHAALVKINSAMSLIHIEKFEEAANDATEALSILGEKIDMFLESSAYLVLCYSQYYLGKYESAMEHFKKFMKGIDTKRKNVRLALSAQIKGDILRGMGDPSAVEAFRESLEIYSAAGGENAGVQPAFSHLGLGVEMIKKGDVAGYEHLHRAKEMFLKYPQSFQIKRGLLEIAAIEKSRLDKALGIANQKNLELSSELDELKKVIDIAASVGSEFDTDEMLNMILKISMRTFGAERGFFALIADGNISYSVQSNFTGDVEFDQDYEHIRRAITTVLDTGNPIVVPGNGSGKSSLPGRTGRIKSVFAIPFIAKMKNVVGLLYLDSVYVPFSVAQKERSTFLRMAEHVASIIQRDMEAIERDRELDEKNRKLELLEKEYFSRFGPDFMVGSSSAMQKVFELLQRCAGTDLPVFIHGESGTGKELAARAIHNASSRHAQPFIAVNCAAIPDSLLESELFGFEKGAFTGADTRRPGLFEGADGGTLFLDEISSMSISMQQKILRVIQEGEVRRIGASSPIKVDVRIISASIEKGMKLVETKVLRKDLYYRLHILSVRMPPLRERLDDVPALVEYFWKKERGEPLDASEKSLNELYLTFSRYEWPGNVRELENEVKRLVHLGCGKVDVSLVSESLRNRVESGFFMPQIIPEDSNLRELLQTYERELVKSALISANWVKKHAASKLGIPLSTLSRKIEKLDIRIEKKIVN